MLDKLRIRANKLYSRTKDEKYELINYMLNDDMVFFKIDIDTSISILRDLCIDEKYIKSVYLNLIDKNNYEVM